MARIKAAVNAHKKRRKIFKLAKGYYGSKSKQYRAASEQVRRSLRYAYEGRKMRKRDFRRLWITRINAAARLNGVSYSVLMNGLKKNNISINRKMLAELAVNDKAAFVQLTETAKTGTEERVFVRGDKRVDYGRVAQVMAIVTGGGFKHLMDGERDGMATEQGYYALTAYARYLMGLNRLYDMRDAFDPEAELIQPLDLYIRIVK